MNYQNVSIVGVGKLGLCLALNLEKVGFDVIGVDVDSNYINSLEKKEFESSEPLVNEYLKSSNNIRFTTDLGLALENDVIFIVVRTPSTSDWRYDHSDIEAVAEKLISLGKQKNRKDLIINCTTFPGYCDNLHDRLKDYNYNVSYNPEFIAQGTIIRDQVGCDMVLIGESDQYAGELISKIYANMVESNPVYNRMTRTEAELTKISLNCFLTTKISFANMIGDIALRLECNPDIVLNSIGSDSRVGSKYLKFGFGFGGPCFPRDNRALLKCAEEVGIDAVISRATDEMNYKHLNYQIEDFIKKNPNRDSKITIEFVTYKKESTLIEESQQMKFLLEIKKLGYNNIQILDEREEVLRQIDDII